MSNSSCWALKYFTDYSVLAQKSTSSAGVLTLTQSGETLKQIDVTSRKWKNRAKRCQRTSSIIDDNSTMANNEVEVERKQADYKEC